MSPIIRGFQNLGRFSGRDGRGAFWPYTGSVILLGFVAAFGVMAVQIPAMMADIQAFAAENPGRVTTEVGPGHYAMSVSPGDPAFMPDMSGISLCLGAVVAVVVALLAAAITRRLHDTGRSGFWALPVPFFLAGGLFLMPRLMTSFSGPEPDMGLFGLLFLNNAAYLLSLGALIIFLILPGKAGVNRFGPPTV